VKTRFCIIWPLAVAAALLTSCLNPFAPVEGDAGSTTWSSQTTIGGLLDNFALAYDYRDSLHYADCLDESFVFYYYDVANGRYDQWYRDTDLKATGGLFRSFNRIDLEWSLIPEWVKPFEQPDTTVGFVVRFNLIYGNEAPLMGYAHFTVRRERQDVFRVLEWRDDV